MSQCASGWSLCPGAGLPNDFCCLSTETCLALAGNTTVLCCPNGADCSNIEAIPCDVGLQDPAKNPEAVIKTTALTATLPSCGDVCCPFGYSCGGNTNCIENEDQSQKPLAAVSSSSTVVSSSSTATESLTSTTTSSTIISTSPLPTSSSASRPVEGLSPGAEAGIAIGAILGTLLILAVIFLGYRLHQVKKREERRRIQHGDMFERQPQTRVSNLWRTPSPAELPVNERRGELEGPEIMRISGLHELDGYPKRPSEIKRSFRRS
ncbi:hypothetical protein F5Y03DRAFT_379361 [Xylaria venustula]|nr:hypothetical protein F5Y03DRAFT_379361 [Xylaria venustula]